MKASDVEARFAPSVNLAAWTGVLDFARSRDLPKRPRAAIDGGYPVEVGYGPSYSQQRLASAFALGDVDFFRPAFGILNSLPTLPTFPSADSLVYRFPLIATDSA
ncbi:MAG: hypothetical protein J4F46_10490 [Dehalococcoidia bacterium]|nr:hypothetical protein [Dehalococcoidia bacterium]